MIYLYNDKIVKIEDAQLIQLSEDQKKKLTKVIKPTIVEPIEYKNESNGEKQPVKRRVANRLRKG